MPVFSHTALQLGLIKCVIIFEGSYFKALATIILLKSNMIYS